MRFTIVNLKFLRFYVLHKKGSGFLFWERFYNLCIKRGTRPNPVGKEIGISSGIISKWKNENTLPSGEILIKIANYLDCSVDYLLGRTDNPEVNK